MAEGINLSFTIDIRNLVLGEVDLGKFLEYLKDEFERVVWDASGEGFIYEELEDVIAHVGLG